MSRGAIDRLSNASVSEKREGRRAEEIERSQAIETGGCLAPRPHGKSEGELRL